MKRHRTRLALGALSLLTAFVGACEPCDGLAACTENPRFAVSGRVVDPIHGLPVPGTRVDLIHTGGESVVSDSVSAVVDASGTFSVAVAAGGVGTGTFDLALSPPNAAPYRVPLSLRSSDVHGEATVVGTLVAQPVFPYSGELHFRGNRDQLIPDVTVVFHRTGGVQLFGPGWQGDQYVQTTSGGRLRLFEDLVFPVGFGELHGDLTVYLPDPYGPSVAHLDLMPTYRFRPPGGLLPIGVGPNLVPRVTFIDRATHKPVPGVQVHFTQTGGVAMGSPDAQVTSDIYYGAAMWDLHPRASGPVTGDAVVTPPPPGGSFTMHDIQLTTLDNDNAFILPDVGVGLHLPYELSVVNQGKPVAGVRVRAQRTSGISVAADTVVGVSDSLGVVRLDGFIPQASGTLVVGLHFEPPSPFTPFDVAGVQMAALDADSDLLTLGTWDVSTGGKVASVTRSFPRFP